MRKRRGASGPVERLYQAPVLHHAIKHEIYGQWMIEELARHGYTLSAGTLYPMLQSMELKAISWRSSAASAA
jgi:DNA-binding PadR family transcriptional regulator